MDNVPDSAVTPSHNNYMTVTHGMSGFFAVKLWWNPDGFWEPWTTGFGRYATREEAVAEAKELAEEEGIEYKE
jgi:hypothetical protein